MRPRPALIAALALVAAALAVPSPAAAAGTFNCDASAVRGSLLGGAPIEPVVANRGAAGCRTQSAGLNVPLPALLAVGSATAATALDGPADGIAEQKVLAGGGLADVRVLALPDLPITLPTPQLGDALASVTIPITGLLQTLLPGIDNLSLDLRPALQALLPDGRLPTLDLVRVQAAMAYAGAQCADGAPRLTGDSRVAGLSVLGQELPTGQLVDQLLTLLDSGSIDPSNIDLTRITLPLGLSLDALVVGPLLTAAIRTVLDTLPPIAIPATIAQVKVTPGTQARTADTLTQQALRVQVSVAGQSLADLVVGEARVSSAGVSCAAPADAGAAAADLVLGCTKRRLVLTDVQQRGGRVRLLGVADRALAGRRIGIRFTHTGRTVARATVGADGAFRATAPIPARRLRSTNAARYQAVVGSERSLSLKLTRRMVLSGTRAAAGKVTLSGRVVRPLGRPVRTITVTRRVSCKRSEVVRRVAPSRTGAFRVTVDAPSGQLAAVYRLSTRVRRTSRNAKTFPTFTLPRAIELR